MGGCGGAADADVRRVGGAQRAGGGAHDGRSFRRVGGRAAVHGAGPGQQRGGGVGGQRGGRACQEGAIFIEMCG